MKKLVAILCALVCSLSLAACAADPAEQAKAESKEYIDGLIDDSVKQNFEIYLNVLALFSNTERAVPEGEELYTYEAISQLSNEEVELILSGADGHGFKTALESFYLSQKNTGKIMFDENEAVIFSDYSAERSGDQILARATVKCEKGDADVELIFKDALLSTLVGGSLNARSTFGDLMAKAGLNTLIGMGTVFAVLILISLIIACFGFIPKIQAAFAKKEEKPEAPKTPAAPAVVPAAPEPVEEADDTELVAVIAAAIAAYEGSTNTEGFVVRSIRRRF